MLLFHAQYLNAQGHQVTERAVFAGTLERAYELALEAAANPIQAINAQWVTIKEDQSMFIEDIEGNPFWQSPFKPVPVRPVPQLTFDASGKITLASVQAKIDEAKNG